MTGGELNPSTRRPGIQDSLIRLSCGIEEAEDLIADLAYTFQKIALEKEAITL